MWVNEHEARAEMDGKKLGEMAAYRASESKVLGNILVERRNPQTFGSDLRKMISDRLTFTEAIARPEYNVMERQRLAVRDFAGMCLRTGAVRAFAIAAADRIRFANWNSPGDLPGSASPRRLK